MELPRPCDWREKVLPVASAGSLGSLPRIVHESVITYPWSAAPVSTTSATCVVLLLFIYLYLEALRFAMARSTKRSRCSSVYMLDALIKSRPNW